MAVTLRSYEPHDFAALHRLDQSCFPAGISYSKTTFHYFLTIASADCIVAADGARIAGFILTEENPPLAHIITLDVAEAHRRHGVGSALLAESEKNLALRGVRSMPEDEHTRSPPSSREADKRRARWPSARRRSTGRRPDRKSVV